MILDTNALSAWADGHTGVEAPLRSAAGLVVPSVVLGEYLFGIRQSRYRHRYEDWLARYLPLTEIATVTSGTADAYADIRLESRRRGHPIPANDAWVAALARQQFVVKPRVAPRSAMRPLSKARRGKIPAVFDR